MGANPFRTASTGGILKDYIDELLIVTPTEYKEEFNTSIGDTDVIIADVVVVNTKNPKESEELTGVIIFWKKMVADLRPQIQGGQPTLGRLTTQPSKAKGKSDAYVLGEYNEADLKAASAYWETKTVNPFKSPEA
jgi:hypothetical protein